MIAKAIEPGQQEVDRPAGIDRDDRHRAEEDEHDDRQDGSRDEGLAAAEREPKLHRRSSPGLPARRARRRRSVVVEPRHASGSDAPPVSSR